MVDVGFFDALEELAGVGGEAFDVAALTFGVDGVEGQRGFARAADTADDSEGVVGNVDVDALEVVGSCTADCNLVEVLLGLLLCHGQTSIVRQDGENCESGAVLQRFVV